MLLWLRQLGTSGTDVVNSVSVDGLGNVYFSGLTDQGLAGSLDAFLGKYDQDGNLIWTRQLGAARNEASVSISADGLGSVYLAGWTDGSLGGPYAGGADDAFVSKYDAAENLRWTQQRGTSNSDSSTGVAADGLGNVYFSGYTGASLGGPNAGQYDAFIAKISDVPEPTSFAVIVIGFTALTPRRLRKQLRCRRYNRLAL